MNARICTREPDVLAAVAAGRPLGSELQSHLVSCRSCQDAAGVARALREIERTDGEAHALPDPGVIWWKAQLLRRWEAERRAAAPVERMYRIELMAGVLSLAVFVAWQWSGLSQLFSLLNPARLVEAGMAAEPVAVSSNAVVAMVAVAVAGVAAMAGLHRAILHRR